MNEDKAGCGFALFAVLLFGAPIGVVIYDGTIGKTARCKERLLVGEVRQLDWSGGWSNGVLIECDTGSRLVKARGHLPAVGDRGYVCANGHWHGLR